MVSFLFTDIEGSTRLLHALGDRYVDLLDQHRRLLRGAAGDHDGCEVDTQGDAFFFAFASASDAVATAADAQRALAAEPWPDGIALRVRMGIHTGEPVRTGEGYVGLDVHRAARIGASAHGGQVVCSRRVIDAAGAMPVGVSTMDLGEHVLKDLVRPEALLQLVIEGLETEFPPLRSLHPTNLPTPVTPLIGRHRELEEIAALLQTDGVRLVTLTGPGGSGKTRLAIEAGAKTLRLFPAGVFFVSLAPISDGDVVLPAVAKALGVHEGASGLLESIKQQLSNRRLLLILDNFEHLIAAAPIVGDLLAGASGLRVLATSRMLLRIAGEQRYPVTPLAVPEIGDEPHVLDPEQSSAVALFMERAHAADPELEPSDAIVQTAARICARLDGLPLAIELAAARVATLSPEEILAHLGNAGEFLTGGARDAPTRHRSLSAAIDWSVDLLGDDERRLFARLGVFSGGFTVDSVQSLCAQEGDATSELFRTLAEASLLVRRRTADGRSRFSMLETIREAAVERLGDEAEGLYGRYAQLFLKLVEEAEPHIQRSTQDDAFLLFDEELDNIRAAMRWSLDHVGGETAGRIAAALTFYWSGRGLVSEGRTWLESTLERVPALSDRVRAGVLFGCGWLALQQSELEAARAALTKAVDLFHMLNDVRGEARALSCLARILPDDHAAYETVKAGLALARTSGDSWSIFYALDGLATAVESLGEPDHGGDREDERSLQEESVVHARRCGDSYALAMSLNNLGWLILREGDPNRAEALFEESLSIMRRARLVAGAAGALGNLGLVALRQGDPSRATAFFREAVVAAWQDHQGLWSVPESIRGLAGTAAAFRRNDRAAVLTGSSDTAHTSVGDPKSPLETWIDENLLAAARTELGEEAWERAYERGKGMSLDEAVTLALNED